MMVVVVVVVTRSCTTRQGVCQCLLFAVPAAAVSVIQCTTNNVSVDQQQR